MFHTYDRDEGETLLAIVLDAIDEAGGNWAPLIFEESISKRTKASLCAVCVMAAIGLQYTRDPIPSMNFETSTEAGTYACVSSFYWVSKELLEGAIETNDLEAMKVCAMLSIFNIIAHSTVALAYTGMLFLFRANWKILTLL